MSLRRRTQLVQLAREFDALIIADDVYDWLRWPAPSSGKDEIPSLPPPRLVDIDRSILGGSVWGNAISNGTFSKIVAPGMRVGWVEGSVLHVRDLCKTGPVRSGGNQGHFASMLISQLLIVGALEEHIHTTLIPIYRHRHRVLVESIEKYLVPLGISVSATGANTSDDLPVSGGFFLYIDFPNDSPSSEVIAKISLEEYNLRIAPGGLMAVAGDESSVARAKRSFGRGARLCWAWHEENEIYEGIQRLASAYQTALRRM
jgi:DNA-binding transcriptional MocR family regulator